MQGTSPSRDGIEVPRLSVCSFNLNRKEKSKSNVTTVGNDLAKNIFCAHGVDARGAVVLKKYACAQTRAVDTTGKSLESRFSGRTPCIG